MSIRAVLFDLDDTLFDHRGAVAGAIVEQRRELWGDGDDTADVERWRVLEELHYHRYLAGELDFVGQRLERARDFADGYAMDLEDPLAWWDAYFLRYRAAWRLHGDARRCLSALGDRAVGIITNGDLAAQTEKLAAVGLDGIPLITSGELGVAKPDPRIFHEACRRLGALPDAAVYVGDRLHTDAIGASRAGLLGVWLDRAGAATPAEHAEAAASSVAVIRTLDALPPVLR